MKLLDRNIDVVTGSTNMEFLHSMPDFPVFMGCVEHSQDKDLTAELTWEICKDSGIVQLKKLIPLDILYQAQHAGAVGAIWMEHHKCFAKFLNKQRPLNILELGGAHGLLSIEYHFFDKIPWTILEPNPAPVNGCAAKFIKGFFDNNFIYQAEFDTIVHSHVFEHIYNPNEFVQQLSRFMAGGKKLVFSVPNMQIMLERKYTNCINFEHTVLLTEPYIEFLLAKYGFRIISKEYFLDDHSIFYATERENSVKPIPLEKGLYEKNKKLYLAYIDYHKALIEDLNNKIQNFTQPIFLFGAHVFAQYLIQMGLETKSISNILDNDIKKQGKRLYGTNLLVQSPKILKDVKSPIVILKAGVYNNEIKKDILENINSRTLFLE